MINKLILSNMCKVTGTEAIAVVKFLSPASSMTPIEFCAHTQEVLCDDIGSSCYFRLAPKSSNNLTSEFILGSDKFSYKEDSFYKSNENEFVIAFFITPNEEDTLDMELTIFSTELEKFCKSTHNLSFVQIDVDELYMD